MFEILQQLGTLVSQYCDSKVPVAIVVKADIYVQLQELLPSVNYQKVFPVKGMGFGLPVLPDPASDSLSMAQTEDCMLFYSHKALELYLKRVKDPNAWVKYCCCKQSGISFNLKASSSAKI